MDWAKTIARRDEKLLSFGIGLTYIRGLTVVHAIPQLLLMHWSFNPFYCNPSFWQVQMRFEDHLALSRIVYENYSTIQRQLSSKPEIWEKLLPQEYKLKIFSRVLASGQSQKQSAVRLSHWVCPFLFKTGRHVHGSWVNILVDSIKAVTFCRWCFQRHFVGRKYSYFDANIIENSKWSN